MKSEKPNTIEQLAIKKATFKDSVTQQITLLSELRLLSVKLQRYEQAAKYRDVEKDFQDVLTHLENTNL